MGKEIWKRIDGYEDYEISNQGRVRNSKGYIFKGNDNGLGYKSAILTNSSGKKKKYIHRLVAMAFIPNPHHKPYVNHIDCNVENNAVENLEWVTPRENTLWGYACGRFERTDEWLSKLHASQAKHYKAVIGTNMSTGEVIYFKNLNGVKDAGFQPSCVCSCCKGKRTDHAGFKWEYAV